MLNKGIVPLTLLLLSIVPSSSEVIDQAGMDKIVGGYYGGSTVLDDAAAHPVADLVITRDIATFTLKSGTLYLTKPVEGAIYTAVFVGQGTASFKPARAMDKTCLDMAAKDHLGKTPGGQIVTAFDQLFITSLDGSIDQIAKSLPAAGAAPDLVTARSVLKDSLDTAATLEVPFDLDLLAAHFKVPDAPTYVRIKSADYGWLEYGYVPRDQLEVQLVSLEHVGNTVRPKILIHTHKSADFDAKGNYVADVVKDQHDWIDVTHYDIAVTIPDTKHFLAEGKVTFTPNLDDLQVIPFTLANNVGGRRTDDKSAKKLTLKGITDTAGKPLPFVHRKNQVWVAVPEPLKKGTSYTLGFSVDAETIFQISSEHFFIVNDAAWYPQHGYIGGIYTMDWLVKAKKPLIATGSGKLVKETTEGPYNVSQLKFERPVWLPFLIFGQYQKVTDAYQAPGGGGVDLAVYYSQKTDFSVEDSEGDLQTVSVLVPGGKPKDVLGEAKEIIKFYESMYGPFPFAQLYVAQMSPGMGFGQGPAGFIQLTGEAFMSSAAIASFGSARSKADFFHGFFSHEIAHQWWGHNIKWASDEDVWLSESFAEYTAGMFVQGLLGEEGFQGKIKGWKDNARIADPHGTVAWANNMGGENGGAWRTNFLYNKGPYIVHMLRMQVGHDNYVKAMKNLMTKYGHQQISTDMLRQEFETVAGYKLDYFFEQWFRGTGIPTIDYSSEVKQTEDGKFLATVKMSQRDKARFKVMQVPVFFHFGKDQVIVKHRPMLQPEDVYQLKLPSKPERITLDDNNTLLADTVGQGDAAGN